jgi:hypothetical protein
MIMVCTKKCIYTGTMFKYHFDIGDQYKLSDQQPGYTDDKICIDIIDGRTILVLRSDFILLEEWRELQIDKIVKK